MLNNTQPGEAKLKYTLPEEETTILNLERRLAWRGDSLPEEE
jgi:hypothetical protein